MDAMTSVEIPESLLSLLTEPNYGILATVRPDGQAQANPMWFELVDGTIRFTHTTKRGKYRNLQSNPTMSLAVLDPRNPFRYVEVRGRLVETIPDPTGAFYVHLEERYGVPEWGVPADAADRVILVMSIEKVSGH